MSAQSWNFTWEEICVSHPPPRCPVSTYVCTLILCTLLCFDFQLMQSLSGAKDIMLCPNWQQSIKLMIKKTESKLLPLNWCSQIWIPTIFGSILKWGSFSLVLFFSILHSFQVKINNVLYFRAWFCLGPALCIIICVSQGPVTFIYRMCPRITCPFTIALLFKPWLPTPYIIKHKIICLWRSSMEKYVTCCYYTKN